MWAKSLQSWPTLHNPMVCSMSGFPDLHHLPEFAQTRVRWVRDAIQPSHPLSPPSPAFHLSQPHYLFSWISSSHLVAKYWSFSICPSHEYSGLISFRIDWFDLLAVQGTLKSLQNHNSRASFFSAQPSLWSNFHIHTWLLEQPYSILYRPLSVKWCL